MLKMSRLPLHFPSDSPTKFNPFVNIICIYSFLSVPTDTRLTQNLNTSYRNQMISFTAVPDSGILSLSHLSYHQYILIIVLDPKIKSEVLTFYNLAFQFLDLTPLTLLYKFLVQPVQSIEQPTTYSVHFSCHFPHLEDTAPD